MAVLASASPWFSPALAASAPDRLDVDAALEFLHARRRPIAGCFDGNPSFGCGSGTIITLLNASNQHAPERQLANQFYLNDNLVAAAALSKSGRTMDQQLASLLLAQLSMVAQRLGLPTVMYEGQALPRLGRQEIFLVGAVRDDPYTGPTEYILPSHQNLFHVRFTGNNAELYFAAHQNRTGPVDPGGVPAFYDWGPVEPRVFEQEDDFADVTLYRALSVSSKGEARDRLEHVASFWDGRGLTDAGFQEAGGVRYQSLSLALLLYAGAEIVARDARGPTLRSLLPDLDELRAQLARVQAPSGGVFRDYAAAGPYPGVATTEVTALAILAEMTMGSLPADRIGAATEASVLDRLVPWGLAAALVLCLADAVLFLVVVRRSRGRRSGPRPQRAVAPVSSKPARPVFLRRR